MKIKDRRSEAGGNVVQDFGCYDGGTEKMTQEVVRMGVSRYRDDQGNPTCARSFERGEVCIFYASHTFGTHEVCWFPYKSTKHWEELSRRDGGKGFLIPLNNCPLWKEEEG